MTVVANVLLGLTVVVLLTALTGYFVAQEFGYMAVDRARLKVVGDDRALAITGRTSFMLSGAQLGITVTGLLVGYVAEPMIGSGVGALMGGSAVALAAGVVFALMFSTVVQMVFGELVPKNLAIARPEPVARRLALSTGIYLKLFGWLIWLFDQAAALLLRAVRIEPVHDVEHAATPRDLEHIVAESRDSGDLPPELSTLLDRVLDFNDATADHAMIPRPQVVTVDADEPAGRAVELMATGYSRLPVIGEAVDEIVGVISLRNVLELGQGDLQRLRVRDVARPAMLVPGSLPLPVVLDRLRESNEEFACVVDEYGGLAGVITQEDIAEELVGEITDEHEPLDEIVVDAEGEWRLPGSTHIDELERLIGHDLPAGDYQTLGGLVISELQRLPEPGDIVEVDLPRGAGEEDEGGLRIVAKVTSVRRRVPETVRLRLDTAVLHE